MKIIISSKKLLVIFKVRPGLLIWLDPGPGLEKSTGTRIKPGPGLQPGPGLRPGLGLRPGPELRPGLGLSQIVELGIWLKQKIYMQ